MRCALTNREKLILDLIIDYYITYAQPIGSRNISKKIDASLSPATIRNVMADLEEMGFLQHLHTSAGRIPTDIGYRYYVDNLLKTFTPNKTKRIGLESLSQIHECGELMEEISMRLSSLSKYIGLIIAPKITDLKMKHMDFIIVSSNKILMVFISTTDWVYNKIIDVKETYSQEELNVINRYLNSECENLTLMEIRSKLIKGMSEEKKLYTVIMENLSLLSEEISKKQAEKIYLQGHANILKHPEFTDVEKMKSLFKTLEEKIKLVKLLDKCIIQEGVTVSIGSENGDLSIKDCSIVMTCYRMNNQLKGALGIIGPTRMRYTEVINLVENVALTIETLFNYKED